MSADSVALEMHAASLEARPRDNRYAVVVVVVDLATHQFCTKFQNLPVIDVRRFWHDVLMQSSQQVLAAKIERST